MDIDWDGQEFTPSNAIHRMAAIKVSPAENVEGKRVPEAEHTGWSFVCPDCNKAQAFYPRTPDSHRC
jgi:hypothetical protein